MRFTVLITALLLTYQTCDFTGAGQQQVRERAEAGLKPYFPAVRVEVDRQTQTLIAYTCASNVGEAAIRAIPSFLDKSEDVQRLKQVHSALKLRTFELGFDQYVLTLDMETNRYDVVQANAVAGYAERYSAACARFI
jgi:hypothetical protein